MMVRALACLLLLFSLPVAAVPAPWLMAQDAELVWLLAARNAPDPQGALGRNRQGYFHARFQTGVHSIAMAAHVQRDPGLAEQALRSIQYAFDRQQPDGGFALAVPEKLRSQRPASDADLASATAFFLASAGSALLMLDTDRSSVRSDWLGPELKARRQALRPALVRALAFLMSRRELLRHADANAPNRLLFNALAFQSLGQILEDEAALAAAADFTRAALSLRHPDGYFIEGGGHDTSYNAVACAVGYRLLALDPTNAALSHALGHAMQWQRRHILDSGEISTQGNTRVRPDGETFLGQTKGMDVAHAVEALAMTAAFSGDERWNLLARRVVSHYRP